MNNFQIYPAVDLKDGNCVRLVHGKENKMTIYEDDPIKQVKFFSNKGFKWVHIVDLNAAFGKYDNKHVLKRETKLWILTDKAIPMKKCASRKPKSLLLSLVLRLVLNEI